ncbi:MAG: hypothetical protein RSC84_04820 [Peptostreptococcaceae bacterium]
MNINVLYIYPKIININKEINLLRIIDKNVKETIIIYSEKLDNIYKIKITNTLHGKVENICDVYSLEKLDICMNKFKALEKDIISMKDLNCIEKYILKMIKN